MFAAADFDRAARTPSVQLRVHARHPHARALEAVELARVFEQGRIAAFPHVSRIGATTRFGFLQPHRLALDQRGRAVVESENPDHGALTSRSCSADTRRSPARPPPFSRGMMVRTVDSSRIVFTASHSSSLKCEMVGFFSAGSTASTAPRILLCDVQHQPDLAQRVDRALQQHA